MTTANKITLARIAMIPAFVVAMLAEGRYSNILALIIFIAASATDGIDGYIARKYDQVTKFGKFIDPLADKLLVTAAILILIEREQMPSWAAMIIITREFAVTALRLVAVGDGVVIPAGLSGKIKTVVSVLGIIVMLTPLHAYHVISDRITVDSLMVTLILVTTVWSGMEYFYKNRKLLNIKE